MSAATQEQKTQAPAYTVQMAEAGFSMNVKMIDPQGQEVMLTFRAPLASHADKLIEHYTANVQRLIDAGWKPLTAGTRPAQGSAQAAAAGDTPFCRVHNAPMKPSRRPGSFFCSKKVGDGYCTEKVG